MTDVGTIHIPLPSGMHADEVDALMEAIADIIYGEQWRETGLCIAVHLDGPCETSPHCGGRVKLQRDNWKRIALMLGAAESGDCVYIPNDEGRFPRWAFWRRTTHFPHN